MPREDFVKEYMDVRLATFKPTTIQEYPHPQPLPITFPPAVPLPKQLRMIQSTQLIEDEEVVPGAENSATVTRRMSPSPTIMMIVNPAAACHHPFPFMIRLVYSRPRVSRSPAPIPPESFYDRRHLPPVKPESPPSPPSEEKPSTISLCPERHFIKADQSIVKCRVDWRLTRNPNPAFSGALGSKSKPDLVGIAQSRQVTHLDPKAKPRFKTSSTRSLIHPEKRADPPVWRIVQYLASTSD